MDYTRAGLRLVLKASIFKLKGMTEEKIEEWRKDETQEEECNVTPRLQATMTRKREVICVCVRVRTSELVRVGEDRHGKSQFMITYEL